MELFHKQYLISCKKPDYDENQVRCIELKNGAYLLVSKEIPVATNKDASAVIAGYAWDVAEEENIPYKIIEELNLPDSSINPEDYFAWKELAFVQSDLCRSAEAVESLNNSIKYDDSEENLKFSLFYMAILQLNQHKKAEALDTAERLAKIDSNLAGQIRVIADMQ